MKLSEQLDRIEVAVDSIRTTIGLENAVIEDVATGTSNKINELNTTITSQSETIVAKDGEITTLTETVATKESEITALNETVDEKDAEIGALNSAIEGKDNTITTLQNQIGDLEEQLPEGNITITENGTHNVAAYETAIVNVMTVVEGGGPTTGTPSLNLGEKHITENGTYNSTDDGLDGYSTVVVDVSQGSNSAYGILYDYIDEETYPVKAIVKFPNKPLAPAYMGTNVLSGLTHLKMEGVVNIPSGTFALNNTTKIRYVDIPETCTTAGGYFGNPDGVIMVFRGSVFPQYFLQARLRDNIVVLLVPDEYYESLKAEIEAANNNDLYNALHPFSEVSTIFEQYEVDTIDDLWSAIPITGDYL